MSQLLRENNFEIWCKDVKVVHISFFLKSQENLNYGILDIKKEVFNDFLLKITFQYKKGSFNLPLKC